MTLLAKDETQRRRVRRLFRDCFPPEYTPDQGPDAISQDAPLALPGTAAGQAQDATDPARRRRTGPQRATAKPIRTGTSRRLSIWWATLAMAAIIIAAAVVTLRPPPDHPDQPIAPGAPSDQQPAQDPLTLPAVPIPRFHDWVAVMEPVAPAALLAAWLPPIALLVAALLGLGWLLERERTLRHPGFRGIRLDPAAEPLLTWTETALRLPDQLDGAARRELVWGVQRFASEQRTNTLDVPGSVRASAAGGLPSLCFEPARFEREVWLWLDQRLQDRTAQALAEEIAERLTRAGLRVRLGSFRGLPERIRYRNRERAEVRDLGDAARQALVAIFTDGATVSRALGRPDTAPGLRRTLRELAGWPRCCMVDFGTPEDDLPGLARGLGLTCIPRERLPAWLAERRPRPGPEIEDRPPPALALRRWAAACALPRLAPTTRQVNAIAHRLGLDPRALPPEAGAAPLGEAERRALLRELASWVWEDRQARRVDEAEQWLQTAVGYWHEQLDAVDAAHTASAEDPEVPDWQDGRGEHQLAIERLLLDLWWGDRRTARAVQRLWDLYQERTELAPLIRTRLNELTARGSEPAAAPDEEPRIRLPWRWQALPEAPRRRRTVDKRSASTAGSDDDDGDASLIRPTGQRRLPILNPNPDARDLEPPGTARQRLLRMGFAGAQPAARPRANAGTRWGMGLLLGLALAGAVGVGERIAALSASPIRFDAEVYESELFQRLARVETAGNRLHAASRKQLATRERLPGLGIQVHWCWTGQNEATLFEPCDDHPSGRCLIDGRARKACEPLLRDRDDPRRINPVRLGDGLLLRAGTLAEPIRACTAPPQAPWPELSVAVIAGEPWDWPEPERTPPAGRDPAPPVAQPWHSDPERNLAARQLAIRLLDSGAVDLALIAPAGDGGAAARIAERWTFRGDAQWLFFEPLGSVRAAAQSSMPTVGTHRARLTVDYAALAEYLRDDDTHGALDLADPPGALSDKLDQVEILAGAPRLWAGPARQRDANGIDWVHICPGTFTMGSAPADDETLEHLRPDDSELPAHPVLLDGFEIARTEMTRGQLARFRGEPIPPPDQARMPAANIDWTDAQRACRALEAERPRLPSSRYGADLATEAQWEYAARGGSQTPYPFPPELETLCTYANGADSDYAARFGGSWANTACSDGYERSAPVGVFPPNPIGLRDMHGNLWEWTRDCWDAGRYGRRGMDPVANPPGQGGDCGWRVLRGGSFAVAPRRLRSAVRHRDGPGFRLDLIGFRCVRGSVRQ